MAEPNITAKELMLRLTNQLPDLYPTGAHLRSLQRPVKVLYRTFRQSAEPYKRRRKLDNYRDFRMLPDDTNERSLRAAEP